MSVKMYDVVISALALELRTLMISWALWIATTACMVYSARLISSG